jgi:hypothetical protein
MRRFAASVVPRWSSTREKWTDPPRVDSHPGKHDPGRPTSRSSPGASHFTDGLKTGEQPAQNRRPLAAVARYFLEGYLDMAGGKTNGPGRVWAAGIGSACSRVGRSAKGVKLRSAGPGNRIVVRRHVEATWRPTREAPGRRWICFGPVLTAKSLSFDRLRRRRGPVHGHSIERVGAEIEEERRW